MRTNAYHLSLHRTRLLKEEPYTHKEAEGAAGIGTDNGKGVEIGKSQDNQNTMEVEPVK